MLYVSIIDQYKHQLELVEAVSNLRRITGWNLTLDLVGAAYQPALVRLRRLINKLDPNEDWIKYHGSVQYDHLHFLYKGADLGLFASTCENLPGIMLELMAAGLPIAASNCSPMTDLIGDAGLFFNPEDPDDIAATVYSLVSDSHLRTTLSSKSFSASTKFSWDSCSDQTFLFLYSVYNKYIESL